MSSLDSRLDNGKLLPPTFLTFAQPPSYDNVNKECILLTLELERLAEVLSREHTIHPRTLNQINLVADNCVRILDRVEEITAPTGEIGVLVLQLSYLVSWVHDGVMVLERDVGTRDLDTASGCTLARIKGELHDLHKHFGDLCQGARQLRGAMARLGAGVA